MMLFIIATLGLRETVVLASSHFLLVFYILIKSFGKSLASCFSAIEWTAATSTECYSVRFIKLQKSPHSAVKTADCYQPVNLLLILHLNKVKAEKLQAEITARAQFMELKCSTKMQAASLALQYSFGLSLPSFLWCM